MRRAPIGALLMSPSRDPQWPAFTPPRRPGIRPALTEQSQAAGHATAHITQNLRSASEQMKATAAALDKGDIQRAFDILRPATIETDRTKVAELAARMWTALPVDERDQTLLLASGRAMRAAANAAVQDELKLAGEIAPKGVRMEVLDRVTVTKEGARQMKAYTDGRIVEFRADLKTQGFARGDRGVVIGTAENRVRLRLPSGAERDFQPGKLARNLKQDAVSVYAIKSVELHRGDRIRWTDNDHDRGLANADLGRVEEVGKGKLTVSSIADGTVHELKAGDRMLERLDLAYAVNVHVAQGMTAKHGIVVMSSHERMLSNAKTFLVAMTRIADKATLVVDDGRKLERAVRRNPGEKTSALDMLRTKEADAVTAAAALPEVPTDVKGHINQYVRNTLAVEQARETGRLPATDHLNRIYAAEDLLDRVRPHGAEDLRAVMDRAPKLAHDLAQGRPEAMVRAWAEEGRVRTEPATYADRFVADWRAASSQIARANDSPDARKAEERMERLGERMGREPALERALNTQVPDRQRGVEDQAMNRVRDREMDMGR